MSLFNKQFSSAKLIINFALENCLLNKHTHPLFFFIADFYYSINIKETTH